MPEYSGVFLLGRSQIRRRILGLLLDTPSERLHLREIARRASTSAGTAARELRRLEEAGLVARDREGQQVYFRSRPESSLYPPVRALVHAVAREAVTPLAPSPTVDRLGLETASRLRSELAGIFGRRLVGVWLFGSRARGDHDPDSDVDVLIVLAEIESYPADLRLSSEVASRLSLETGVTISRLLATREAWERGDRPILRVIAAEGVRA